MPKMSSQEPGERRAGFRGRVQVTLTEIAEKIIDAHDEYPAALRAVYNVEGKEQTVTLAVPLDNEQGPEQVKGFLTSKIVGDWGDEPGMRAALPNLLKKGPLWVNVWNNYIRYPLAGPGHHRGQVRSFRKSTASDGKMTMWIELATSDGLVSSWGCPYKEYPMVIGDTPDGDRWGIEGESVNPSDYWLKYAIALGLDWDKLNAEIEAAPCLWPKHYDSNGTPIPALFPDMNDLTGAIYEAVQRHGPKTVEWDVVDHAQYGIGPRRGEYSWVELTPVIIESASDGEFRKEAERFASDFEMLTKVIHANNDVLFQRGTKLTPEGLSVAKAVIKPVVLAYPQLVTNQDQEGKPMLFIPPEPQDWQLNGLVCINFVAERLMAAESKQPGLLFQMVNLTNPDPKALLDWVAENVPEIQDSMSDEKEAL